MKAKLKIRRGSNRKAKVRKPFLMTAFERWIEATISDIFEAAEDVCEMSRGELAVEAELSVSTVHNLFHRITKQPRASTIYKLTKAVGMSMEAVKLTQKQFMKKVS